MKTATYVDRYAARIVEAHAHELGDLGNATDEVTEVGQEAASAGRDSGLSGAELAEYIRTEMLAALRVRLAEER